MITDDADALIEKIAHALGKENYVYGPNAQALFRDDAVAVLPIVEAKVRKAKAEVLTKRWVCQVARSGYHNGASCRPDDAHNDWGCDYYYEASIPATEYETGDSDEHR